MTNENPVNELKCYCCKSLHKEDDSFCGVCGYPFKGTLEAQKQHSINYTLNNFEKEDSQANVREAQIVLFILAAVTLIFPLISYFKENDLQLLIINIILAGLYAGLGIWSRKKPFAAILTGVLIYISIIMLNGIFEPSTIFKGIIIKVIFIGAFIKAAYGAYKFKLDKD